MANRFLRNFLESLSVDDSLLFNITLLFNTDYRLIDNPDFSPKNAKDTIFPD